MTQLNTCHFASPCVRNCCLNDEDICLGCFRSLDEIVAWSAASADEKRATLARCRSRRESREAN